MFLGLFINLFLFSISWAGVGQVKQIIGGESAYIIRDNQKIFLTSEFELEQGDEIFSEQSVLNILIHPTGQYRLSKNTVIKITQNYIQDSNNVEKSFSVIDFIKGIIRAQIVQDETLEIDHKIQAKDVAFAIRGTEFEVSQTGDDFDLDVVEGAVEVSSPHIQTFVPEIVKANEGFRFNRKERAFKRRQFRLKNPENPKFLAREEIRKIRRMNRLKRQQERDLKRPKLTPLERSRIREERREQKQSLKSETKRKDRFKNKRSQR